MVNLHYCKPLRASEQLADDLWDDNVLEIVLHRLRLHVGITCVRVIYYDGSTVRHYVDEQTGLVTKVLKAQG